jgi:hypothetical protein
VSVKTREDHRAPARGRGRHAAAYRRRAGDKIKEDLADAGRLGPSGTLHIGTLKMQHHGSIRDVDREFLRTVTSNIYVLSGDDKHGNPDRSTLELLFAERPYAAMALVTTYPLDEIVAERKREHAKE